MYKVSIELLERIHKCLDVSGRGMKAVSYEEKVKNNSEIRELKTILETQYQIPCSHKKQS